MDETPSPARDTLRDMWVSRPVRPRDDRKLAGVAAAVARRYEVDPTLVRIGFVVSALVGPGLPLYLAGCAVLPDAGPPGGRPGPSRPGSALSVVLLVLAGLLTIPLVFQVERLVATIATAGILLALHLTRGARAGGRSAATAGTPLPAWSGGPSAPGAGASTAAAPPEPGASVATPPEDPAAPERTPPAWDPLGAAPFAWDLPEPGPEPGPPPAPRSKLTPVTLAVALIVGGMVGVLALTAPGAVPASAVPGAALAVVGIGLVIGAFRGSGRWLIPFAVLLALVTALTGLFNAAVGPDGWAMRGGVGAVSEAPASVGAVAPEYRRGTGTIDLDLRQLDLGPALAAEGPVRTRAEVGAGTVTVQVPRDADLVVRGSAGFGDVTVDGQSRSGQDARLTVVDPGPDGPGGRAIELDLRAEMGAVEVRRG